MLVLCGLCVLCVLWLVDWVSLHSQQWPMAQLLWMVGAAELSPPAPLVLLLLLLLSSSQ
jgi:hypothetical protein